MEKQIEALTLGIKMTIRLEGLTSGQVDQLHKAVENARTEVKSCGRYVHEPGEGIKFVEILKSQLHAGCGYTVLLVVHPALMGYIYPPLAGNAGHKAVVFPSREGLGGIFDAVKILPPEDVIEDVATGVVPGKFGYGQPDDLKVEGVGLR
jgi:hypothetical protein